MVGVLKEELCKKDERFLLRDSYFLVHPLCLFYVTSIQFLVELALEY